MFLLTFTKLDMMEQVPIKSLELSSLFYSENGSRIYVGIKTCMKVSKADELQCTQKNIYYRL